MKAQHAMFVIAGMIILYMSLALSLGLPSAAPPPPPAQSPITAAVVRADEDQPALPFRRYFTTDELGREITFYLTDARDQEKAALLPLILVVQGSGAQSAFIKVGDRIGGGLQSLTYQIADGRSRVMIVEKPGVAFTDDLEFPGTAMGATEEFLREHTAERWAIANVAALRAAWTLPGIDRQRTLVIGHSEGALMSTMIASREPRVTHVASLCGGGPTQLFDLLDLMSRDMGEGDTAEQQVQRREHVLSEWRNILDDPDSIEKFWMGHPYRRWSSFLKHNLLDELLQTDAHVFLAQGTRDSATSIHAHDLLIAELTLRGRSFTELRIIGADHGFSQVDEPSDGPPTGMRDVFSKVVQWFFDDSPQRPADP